jgi:hypothetical protein
VLGNLASQGVAYIFMKVPLSLGIHYEWFLQLLTPVLDQDLRRASEIECLRSERFSVTSS